MRPAILASCLVVVLPADGSASPAGPRTAAAVLVTRLQAESRRAHADTFAASKVVGRNGRLWLAVGSSPSSAQGSRVRIYRWSGRAWRLRGDVRGALGPSRWINAVSLTGSRDPDFAIQGCGAGDTNCLSVVSDVGGRWHAVPFDYGYGRTLEVNGVAAGRLVHTEVDACGCAGGPSTWTYEHYRDGAFAPVDPPGTKPICSLSRFATIADPWFVDVLRFTHAECAGGWALAAGDGAGLTGRAVGLFDRGSDGRGWELLTLDNGNAFPTAPAIYDVPLSLLERLARPFGATFAPELGAAKLIARLQSVHHFAWPQQNGVVSADGRRWLIAVVPARHGTVGAVVYRWSRAGWSAAGRLPRVRSRLDVDRFGGWFVSVAARTADSVAFALVGSCCTTTGGAVITNAGGRWHVASR